MSTTEMGSIVLFLLNIYFYTLFLLFSAVSIPILTIFIASLSVFLSRRQVMRWFRRVISWYGRLTIILFFPFIRVRYEDRSSGNAPAPAIFVCNHRSSSDPFLVSLFPGELVQVVNVWPFRIPVLGRFARLAGYLNINRMSPEAFLEKALALVSEKVSVVFFPEGTRSGGKKMGSFHGAAFRLALQANVPIVPICISGNERMPARHSLLLRPGLVRVRMLPAITQDCYDGLPVFPLKNRVRDIIRNELALMENRV
ncbi:MAG: lysophospholipid acyltransferase family protein [Pseudomonadota bacterium]